MEYDSEALAERFKQTLQSKKFKDSHYALKSYIIDCNYSCLEQGLDSKTAAKQAAEQNKNNIERQKRALKDAEKILNEIRLILSNQGISAKLKGTRLLAFCIFIKAAFPDKGMMELYKIAAAHYGISAGNAENQCRYACSGATNLTLSKSTVYENVTVRDLVFQTAELISQRFDVARAAENYKNCCLKNNL